MEILYYSCAGERQLKVKGYQILMEYICKLCRHILAFSITYCQAQPKLQVKLSLKAELVLISINPAPTQQPGLVVKWLEISKSCLESIVALSQYKVG